MPDSEALKLLIGPFGALVLLAVIAWKLWARVVELQAEKDKAVGETQAKKDERVREMQDRLDKQVEVVMGLVRDSIKADHASADAMSRMTQSFELATRLMKGDKA